MKRWLAIVHGIVAIVGTSLRLKFSWGRTLNSDVAEFVYTNFFSRELIGQLPKESGVIQPSFLQRPPADGSIRKQPPSKFSLA